MQENLEIIVFAFYGLKKYRVVKFELATLEFQKTSIDIANICIKHGNDNDYFGVHYLSYV
jgi:hypothetical protein